MYLNLLLILVAVIGVGCRQPSQSPTVSSTVPSGKSHTIDEYKRGKQEAHRDLKAGKMMVKTFGLPQPWIGTYRDILRSQYGVEDEAIAGCIVDDGILDYSRGYNEVSKAFIQKNYKMDIFEKAAEEARLSHKQKINNAKNSYTVRAGDNLIKIAKGNQTTVSKLKTLNNLSADKIVVGQKLKIR